MIEIRNLHVEINNKEVLKGVNLNIPDNEVHSLFGPNGSGKSVLISTIMGYPEYEITNGEILFNGQNITDLNIGERVRIGIGVSEQRPPVIKGGKLRNLVDLLAPGKMQDEKFREEIRERFNMEQFLDRNINDGLSGGEIKKSELFLLMLTKPEFLILDEPDSGVDPEHLKKIGAMINETLQKKIQVNGKKQCNPLVRNSGLIATHSASILNYVYTNKAHIMLDGKIQYMTILASFPDTYSDIGGTVLMDGENSGAELVARAVNHGGTVIQTGLLIGAAKGTRAHVDCSGLMMSDKGIIEAIPGLRAMHPDARMSHEAAIGRIDMGEVNYLQSKGLEEMQAIALIVRGFLDIGIEVEGLDVELEKTIMEISELSGHGEE